MTTTRPGHLRTSGSRAQHTPLGRRRGFGDVARGLVGAITLIALLVGFPWLLLRIGWPLVPETITATHGLTALAQQLLTTPDDGSLFLGALTAVAWVAWATFLAAVLMELLALGRGRLPRRLPLLGFQQQVAGGLVASVAVLISGPLAVAAPPTHLAAFTPASASTSVSTPVSTATTASPFPAHDVLVTVQRGDTLWRIAETQLGDGEAYQEIAEATRPITQPDGRQLEDPDRIYPGWQVAIPAPATSDTPATSAPVTPAPVTPAPVTPAPVTPAPAPSAPPSATSTPSPTSPAAPTPSSLSPSDSSSSTASKGPATPATREDAPSSEGADVPAELLTAAEGLGLSVLTAAGFIALLRRRRSRQQRRRRAGQRLPTPPAAVTDTERRLAAAQDPVTVADLDAGLRALARDCHHHALPLPRLRFVRLIADTVELHLAEPLSPVAPFTALGAADTLWTATRSAMNASPSLSWEEETAPYPTLVALGTDLDGGQILVDLEQAGGLTIHEAPPSDDTRGDDSRGGDTGEPAVAGDAVTAALIVELATTAWGEDLEVICLGGHGDLVAALDVDRMRCVEDVPHLIAELRTWASTLDVTLDPTLGSDLLDGRAQESLRELLRPRILLIGQIDADVHHRLLECVADLRSSTPALPLTVICGASASDRAASTWSITLDATATVGRLDPIGLSMHPHQLDAATREHALQALAVASRSPRTPDPVVGVPSTRHAEAPVSPPASIPDPELALPASTTLATPVEPVTPPPPSALPPAAAEDVVAREHPMITVLGPVKVIGARGEISSERHRASMLEALAFMALHPHRERYPLDEALWPGERVPDARRQQLISRARRWLGTDDRGAPYVLMVNPDGYTLSRSVRTDWQQFQDLGGTCPATASTSDLDSAMKLVRGQPFAGHSPRRYGWADADAQDMIAAIVDVAHELAQRAQRDGDALRARRAAARGLLVEPSSELLWRDALGAEWLAGNRPGLEAMTDRFLALAEELGGDLEPETSELLEDLFNRLPRLDLDPAPVGGSRAP